MVLRSTQTLNKVDLLFLQSHVEHVSSLRHFPFRSMLLCLLASIFEYFAFSSLCLFFLTASWSSGFITIFLDLIRTQPFLCFCRLPVGIRRCCLLAGVGFSFHIVRPVSYTHLRAHETRHDLV